MNGGSGTYSYEWYQCFGDHGCDFGDYVVRTGSSLNVSAHTTAYDYVYHKVVVTDDATGKSDSDTFRTYIEGDDGGYY